MKNRSDNFKQLSAVAAGSAVHQARCRILLAVLLGFVSLWYAVATAQAGDLIHASARIAGDNETEGHGAGWPEPGAGSLTDLVTAQYEQEVHCLALNIYFEARSEPEAGQRAVGHVVMNRVAHKAYPSSVCEVVQQGGEQRRHRCQFSWWCDGRSDKPVNRKAWSKSMRLARQIYQGILEDTTDGALWYHATYVEPYWSKILQQGDRIGQHIFYLENRLSNNTL